MGRRALRKIDPGLDLSGVLVRLEELPEPLDPAVLFGRAAPLEIEIGSGKGLFMTTAPLAEPAHDFLGIEISPRYARFAAARIVRRGIANARIIEGDAVRLFTSRLPAACAAAVHVYFPDPWWKQRHKKRRVMTPAMAAAIQRCLVSQGTLHFWTDVEEYFQTTLDLVGKETSLAGPFTERQLPAEHDLDYRTHFERRARLVGQTVYRAVFRKHQ